MKAMNATEIAVQQALKAERLEILLKATKAKSLDELIAYLESKLESK